MKKKHLTFDERKIIENMLKEGASFRNIGERIGKSHTTVSREVKGRLVVEQKGAWGMPFNDCIHRFNCTVKGSCKNNTCSARICRNCDLCLKTCKYYQREYCPKLNTPPYVCNSCKDKRKCTLEKHTYRARSAQKEYEMILKDFRTGLNICEREYLEFLKILKKGLKKGQSIYHIHETNKDSLMCSSRSLYNYANLEVSGITSLEMPRQARFKKRKSKKTLKLDRRCREGRSLEDFKNFLERTLGFP